MDFRRIQIKKPSVRASKKAWKFFENLEALRW